MPTQMLSFAEMERRREEGCYGPMATLTSSHLNPNDRIEVLNSYGETRMYRIDEIGLDLMKACLILQK